MNEITKKLQKRFVEANKGFTIEDTELKWGEDVVIDRDGDVNYDHANLSHKYFCFNNGKEIKIETQEQANEFFDVITQYFLGVEFKKNKQNEKIKRVKKITKEVVDRILAMNINGIEEKENGSLLYKCHCIIDEYGDVNYTVWHEGTLKHDYFRFIDDSIEIKIETKEQADEFVEIVANYFGVKYVIRSEKPPKLEDGYKVETDIHDCLYVLDNKLWAYTDCLNNLCPVTTDYIDKVFDQHGELIWEYEKPFNVEEELCKIKMPGKLRIQRCYGDVWLAFNGKELGQIFSTNTIMFRVIFTEKQKIERYEKFGNELKSDQGKEFVKWVAETLGGEYDA